MTQQEKYNIEKKALELFSVGKNRFGKERDFAPLLQNILDKALKVEMRAHQDNDAHVVETQRSGGGHKMLITSSGTFELKTSQGGYGNSHTTPVNKCESHYADDHADKIIDLYGLGMTFRNIGDHIKETYGTETCSNVLTEITDRIIPEIKEWQSRPLDATYCIIWLDTKHYDVKVDGKTKQRTVYNVLGINNEGYQEVLGIYLSENEDTNFWPRVLTDLNNRGLKDILIASTNNLTGLTEAVLSVFPKTVMQLCITHQVRTSLKNVASTDLKEFMQELTFIYKANSKEEAEDELSNLAGKWSLKYPEVIQSWQNNWEYLSSYFAYTDPLRSITYTANTMEGFQSDVRKITKTKRIFSSDMELMKLVYLATKNLGEKWTAPLQDWESTEQQLCIAFEGRMSLGTTTSSWDVDIQGMEDEIEFRFDSLDYL